MHLAAFVWMVHHSWIKNCGHGNKGNDHKLKILLIVRQILPESAENV